MSYFTNGHPVYYKSWTSHDVRLNPLRTGKKAHKKLMKSIANNLTPKLQEELTRIESINRQLGHIKS